MTYFIHQYICDHRWSYVCSHMFWCDVFVCICVFECALTLLGAFTWAHQCKKWVNPTVPSSETQAVTGLWEAEGREGRRRSKGLFESEAVSHIAVKAPTRNIQRARSIYTACCLRGWTEQRANQMCYLYGVKARLLTEYVRNPSLTLNVTFMLLHLMTSHMWSDLDVFWRTSQGAEGEPTFLNSTQWYIKQKYFMKDDCWAALPIHIESIKIFKYSHNQMKILQPTVIHCSVKYVTSSLFKVTGFRVIFPYSKY